MRRVRLDKLEPGMKLAQKILRDDGMLLVGAGTELTEPIISMIQRRIELEAIMVEGSAFATPEEAEAWKKDELDKLDLRFSKVAGDPFMERLKELEAQSITDTD